MRLVATMVALEQCTLLLKGGLFRREGGMPRYLIETIEVFDEQFMK